MGFSIQIGWFWILVIVIAVIYFRGRKNESEEYGRRMAEQGEDAGAAELAAEYMEEPADRIIYAILTCPNKELYEPSLPKLGFAEKQVWGGIIGDCFFEEEAFQAFLEAGIKDRYLVPADAARSRVEVTGLAYEKTGLSDFEAEIRTVVQVNAEDPVVVRFGVRYGEHQLLEDFWVVDDRQLIGLLESLKK